MCQCQMGIPRLLNLEFTVYLLPSKSDLLGFLDNRFYC